MAGYWLNGVKYSNVQLIAGENALSLDYWIGNANLTMMVVPESVTSIEGTFQQFPNLAEIVVANSEQVVANLDTAFANTEAVGNDGLFWVADNLLTAYQTAYPTLNFDKWTNYTQYTIPYIGNAELTASYVQQLAQANPASRAAATVIVPVEFTSYESGAITAIQTAFTNMGHLITNYEAGSIDWNIGGDIETAVEQAIVSAGATLDTAFANARLFASNKGVRITTGSPFGIAGLYIVPPLFYPTSFSASDRKDGNDQTVAIYATKVKHWCNPAGYSYLCNLTNMLYLDIEFMNELGSNGLIYNSPKLKWFYATAEHGVIGLFGDMFGNNTTNSLVEYVINGDLKVISGEGLLSAYAYSQYLEKVIMQGYQTSINLTNATLLTRQAIIDFFNSLGTGLASYNTITLGTTNLNKITADDIAIATAKNWVVQ